MIGGLAYEDGRNVQPRAAAAAMLLPVPTPMVMRSTELLNTTCPLASCPLSCYGHRFHSWTLSLARRGTIFVAPLRSLPQLLQSASTQTRDAASSAVARTTP